MPNLHFPKDFLWGSATAAFQVEGSARSGGRGESIWDRFCSTPGKVHGGDNGDVSCDQYHRFPEDIALMRAAGLGSYRFSLSWPRILPSGRGTINPEGIDYYKRLIAALLEAKIEPAVTLYHWDLPQTLQDAGGWAVRDTAYAFAEFATLCFKEFGPSVKKWITLNEPWCSAYLGHLWGVHAPGLTDRKAAFDAVHHLNLAHGLAVKAFRAQGCAGEIGITWNLATPRPATRREEDLRAAERMTDRDSRMFTGPVFGKGYPEAYLSSLGIDLPIAEGDMACIAEKIDFAGLNYYSEHAVSWEDGSQEKFVIQPSWQEVTDMGWPIVPEGFLRNIRWMAAESGGIPLYITENGCAMKDIPVVVEGGRRRIHDRDRIAYLRSHLTACSRAIAEGVPLKGYYLWSLIDNFEWAFGYSKRFGIIYCDFHTLERVPKDSYYYYRDVVAGYGE